jgi:DNA-binding beta-propeller fold protein YncE
MSEKSAVIKDSEKARRYLDDVTDAAARQEILLQARRAGIESLHLSLVTHSAVFHTGDSLSPAAGIAIDGQGRVVVSDEFNHRLVVYDGSGVRERTIGAQGGGDGEFHYPRGLVFDDNGNLYVADAWNHRVVVLNPDFSFKGFIGKLGSGAGELDEPVGVAWSGGRLAVLEKSNHRVQLFGDDGQTLGAIGARGSVFEQEQFYLLKTLPEEFCAPVFEFPSAIAADSAGSFYVADTNNHRIVKIGGNGRPDSAYVPSGLRYPTGLSLDKNDNLHVTQFNRAEVRVFSPEGILLYGYRPAGIDMPVAIDVDGGTVYVGAGMQAGVSVNGLEPDHDAALALEEDFSFHFKKAVALFRAGDFDEAVEHLSLAASLPAEKRPSAAEFAASLPENDYAFYSGELKKIEAAGGFVKILDGFSGSLWEGISSLFDKKLAAVDDYSGAMLRLEKALLIGIEDDDRQMVDRYRAIKKVFNLSSELKSSLAGFKKLQEFQRRLAFCGIGQTERPERIAGNIARITEWKKRREQWYEAAEREAPALAFNSEPDKREVFVQNQARLEMFSFEFHVLWELAGEFNRETASLIRETGWAFSPRFKEMLLEAVDFCLFCPDGMNVRMEYFHTLEELFDAAGEENLSGIMSGHKDIKLWEPLGQEENIPYKTKPEVYRLLPALWSSDRIACDGTVSADAWEKITDFYHKEFARYINENTPLRTELIRSAQLLPSAEKSDKKQAVIIQRKLGLLWFHNYYQDRYMGNTVLEYLVRFALLALENSPVSREQMERTAGELGAFLEENTEAYHKVSNEAVMLDRQIKSTSDSVERNKIYIKRELKIMEMIYHENLSRHLRLAHRRSLQSAGKIAQGFRRVCRYSGGGAVLRPVADPSSVAFGDGGELGVLMHTSGEVVILDENGQFVRSFAGYGSIPGRLEKPFDLAPIPDGGWIVSEFYKSFLTLFSHEGDFIRRIALKGNEGRSPSRLQVDSSGRLFVSFFDGEGLAIHDMDGNLLGKIDKKGTELEQIKVVWGFRVINDKIIVGGDGKFIMVDLDGKISKSLAFTETRFGVITQLAAGEDGTVYAADHVYNRIFAVDAGFTEVKPVTSIITAGVGSIAVKGRTLAVADFIGNSVELFEV